VEKMTNVLIHLVLITGILISQEKEIQYLNIVENIESFNQEDLEERLKKGIDFTFAPKEKRSVLATAVYKKNYDAVSLLVKYGADLNSMEGGFEGTAIMFAAYNNDVKMIDLLLSLGADIDQRDGSFGDPAINWAAYAGHRDVVNHLLKKGASPYFVGHGDALDIAMRRGHEEMVQDLTTFMKLNVELNGNRKILYQSVLNNDLKQAKMILDLGFSPNLIGKYNRPLIHSIARLGHLEMLKLFHQYGAELDKLDRIHFTALMYASLYDKADIVEYLLKNGANYNHISNTHSLNLSPIHLAAIGASIKSVKLLAENGANLNALGSTGSNALLWGLFEGSDKHVTVAIKLIELGADPTIKNKSDYSAENFAKNTKNEELIKIIEEWKK
jgi:uncharacterized protein